MHSSSLLMTGLESECSLIIKEFDVTTQCQVIASKVDTVIMHNTTIATKETVHLVRSQRISIPVPPWELSYFGLIKFLHVYIMPMDLRDGPQKREVKYTVSLFDGTVLDCHKVRYLCVL